MSRKYPKLPNGFGSIKKLSGKRTNPYAVYPPVTEFRLNGSPVTPKALAYVSSWIAGFGVLTAYHSGSYTPGQELPDHLEVKKQADLIQGIVSDFNTAKRVASDAAPQKTFKDIYEEFFSWKFERDRSKTYSINTINCTKTAFKHLSTLHNCNFLSLRHEDLQRALDESPYRYASIEQMVNLLHQMYKYTIIYEYTHEDYSKYIQINIPDDDESGVPLTDEELKILWNHSDDPSIELMLIICYSGYRITAWKSMTVNLEERYFFGGVKTKTSKNRTVPIYSGIYDLVERRMKRDGCMLNTSVVSYRTHLYSALEKYGVAKHTPHDGRHTFSRLCEKYQVRENDRKRMLGHSFGSDITNSIYGHRTTEDLREEIEKIEICR